MNDNNSENRKRTDDIADNKRLLRLPEVLRRVPVSRSSWYSGIRAGRYPRPVKLAPRTVAWRETDIDRLCNE
jgi:prophage regulatory protein